MRPGVPGWAESSLWATGPSAGQPTKAPPTAGRRLEGYHPQDMPSPQILNWLLHELGLRSLGAASLRVMNWLSTSTAALVAGGVSGGAGEGCYDAAADTHDVIDDDGFAFEESSSLGGLIYAVGTPPISAPGTSPTIAADGVGNRGVAGDAVGLFYSAARGAWAIPGPWTEAGPWGFIRHGNGLWLIAKDAGTPALGKIKVSTGPAVAFVDPTTVPAWGGGAVIYCVEHSHHPAAKLYPADPGNQYWVALTATQRSRSADGDIWSAPAAHGMSGAPWGLAYSAFGTKWIAILSDGTISYSTTGLAWAGASPLTSSLGALTEARIACDGYGDWVIALSDGSGIEVHVSSDNGVTWRRVHLPVVPPPGHLKLWYGGGRFHLFADSGAATFAAYVSFRADE